MFGLWEVMTNRLRGGPTCVIYTVFVVHFVFTVEQQRAVTTLSPWAVGRPSLEGESRHEIIARIPNLRNEQTA